MKTRPKTCHVQLSSDKLVDFISVPVSGWQPSEYMRPEGFLQLFGWLPGKRPVEVRLDRVHRKTSGRFKSDRKTVKRRAKR